MKIVRETHMNPAKLILTEPSPSPKGVWGRMVLAMSIVVAATVAVMLLWRAANWPGYAAARALVMGFGIAFGARFGATGRLRGQMTVQLVIGAIGAALFYLVFLLSAS
jgi:hypothetical protein